MQYHEKIFWLAVNAYHEARGEPFSGQKAVCHVVLNRASLRKQTVKEVILAPFQFSWHNGGIFPPIDDYPSFCRAFHAAEIAFKEHRRGDFFGGADHYFADYIAPPSWSKGMRQVTKIGHHIFFQSGEGLGEVVS